MLEERRDLRRLLDSLAALEALRRRDQVRRALVKLGDVTAGHFGDCDEAALLAFGLVFGVSALVLDSRETRRTSKAKPVSVKERAVCGVGAK